MLQESLETAERQYSAAEIQIKQLNKELEVLKFENDNLKVG